MMQELALLHDAIRTLDVDQARNDVRPFMRHPDAVAAWSPALFLDVVSRLRIVA